MGGFVFGQYYCASGVHGKCPTTVQVKAPCRMDERKGEMAVSEIHGVDRHGFVRLVDTMGDDMAVVRAARVSYGNESKGEKADEKLIHYLNETQSWHTL